MLIKRIESFICDHCGLFVEYHQGVSRNHCPQCFWSKHIDIVPGDRKAVCGGSMIPLRYVWHTRGVRIVFVCLLCGHQHRNIQSNDDHLKNLDQAIADARPLLGK